MTLALISLLCTAVAIALGTTLFLASVTGMPYSHPAVVVDSGILNATISGIGLLMILTLALIATIFLSLTAFGAFLFVRLVSQIHSLYRSNVISDHGVVLSVVPRRLGIQTVRVRASLCISNNALERVDRRNLQQALSANVRPNLRTQYRSHVREASRVDASRAVVAVVSSIHEAYETGRALCGVEVRYVGLGDGALHTIQISSKPLRSSPVQG